MKLRCQLVIWMLALFAATASGQAKAPADVPQKAAVCELLRDPKAWNHKLVQVTGFASYGFENSGFGDPACDFESLGLWMAYGGRKRTQVKSTVNDIGLPRLTPLKVEGITMPLVDDATFERFDSVLKKLDATGHVGNSVHATVIARFFAGRLGHYPGGDYWSGFGHLGCCSLFVIQQVLETQALPDSLDANGDASYPDAQRVTDLDKTHSWTKDLKTQQQAETGESEYLFTDPDRVAQQSFEQYVEGTSATPIVLHRAVTSAFRVIYEGVSADTKTRYRIVVSKPAWLSFYAKDPTRVVWVVIGAFEYSGGV